MGAKTLQGKKENFLYFTHKRNKFSHDCTATNTGTDWNAVDELQTFDISASGNGADTLTVGEIDVFITHANDKDEESLVGSAYNDGAGVLNGRVSGSAVATFKAGERVKLAAGSYSLGGTRGETLTIDKQNGNSADSTNGYNLETGDLIEVEFEPIAGLACIWPADMFLGMTGTNTTTTVLKFRAHVGVNDDVDEVTLTHSATVATNKGAMSGFAYIANMMAAVCEATPKTKGDFIEVVDMYDDIFFGDANHNEAAITQSIITLGA
jgi:hypothetical protein